MRSTTPHRQRLRRVAQHLVLSSPTPATPRQPDRVSVSLLFSCTSTYRTHTYVTAVAVSFLLPTPSILVAICSRLQHETWWKLDEGSIQAIRTPFYFLNEPNQVGEPNVIGCHSSCHLPPRSIQQTEPVTSCFPSSSLMFVLQVFPKDLSTGRTKYANISPKFEFIIVSCYPQCPPH